MIFKTLPRHSPTYASLISYILKEGKGMDDKPEVITHNLRSTTVPGWTKEFALNETFRKQSRSDQVHMYHDILSFSSNEDTTKITKEMLHDIATRYIQLRGYDGMYLGAVHREKGHIHIHFCTSGVKFRTGQAFRLSHEQMRTLKTELQQYHQRKYPELTESICRHGAGNRYVSNQKWHTVEKKERQEVKDILTARVQECFNKATSQKEFMSQLNDMGISMYERNGKPTGITYRETKFRFSRLGIDITALSQQLEKENNKNMERKNNKTEQQQLKELQSLREDKREQERGLQKELITEQDGQTSVISYNNLMKETVTRNSDGTETVNYERISEEERERLDNMADKVEYYSNMNEFMEQESPAPDEVLEEFDLTNIESDPAEHELDELRENSNEEKDVDIDLE